MADRAHQLFEFITVLGGVALTLPLVRFKYPYVSIWSRQYYGYVSHWSARTLRRSACKTRHIDWAVQLYPVRPPPQRGATGSPR